MAYIINKTDGSQLVEVSDGQINTSSCNLILVGKNYSGYGEYINENFIKLLENFANNQPPNSLSISNSYGQFTKSQALTGQLWYDTNEYKLKVYNGKAFVPVSSAIISNSKPTSMNVGDLWFDSINKQLYFFDGINPLLLGPAYSLSQELSGIKVQTVLDVSQNSKVVTTLYNNNSLIGIFASEEFILNQDLSPILGFGKSTGNKIYPGFNASDLENIKFHVTATNSENLGGVPITDFARLSKANVFADQTSFKKDILIGAGLDAQLYVQNGNFYIVNTVNNSSISNPDSGKIELKTQRNGILETAVSIIPGFNVSNSQKSREIKFYDGYLNDSSVTVGGSLYVKNKLSVGDNIVTLSNNSGLINDEVANAGGILLKGDVNHKLMWIGNKANVLPSHLEISSTESIQAANLASKSWNVTENFNLLSTGSVPVPEYKINGVTVITSTSLGPNITEIPGITQVGVLKKLEIGLNASFPYLRLKDNNISSLTDETSNPLDLILNSSKNIKLTPESKKIVLGDTVGETRIVGIKTTNDNLLVEDLVLETSIGKTVEELSESTNKKFVLNLVRSRSLSFAVTLDNATPSELAIYIRKYLELVAPVDEYDDGVIARVWCKTQLGGDVVKTYMLVVGADQDGIIGSRWVWGVELGNPIWDKKINQFGVIVHLDANGSEI